MRGGSDRCNRLAAENSLRRIRSLRPDHRQSGKQAAPQPSVAALHCVLFRTCGLMENDIWPNPAQEKRARLSEDFGKRL